MSFRMPYVVSEASVVRSRAGWTSKRFPSKLPVRHMTGVARSTRRSTSSNTMMVTKPCPQDLCSHQHFSRLGSVRDVSLPDLSVYVALPDVGHHLSHTRGHFTFCRRRRDCPFRHDDPEVIACGDSWRAIADMWRSNTVSRAIFGRATGGEGSVDSRISWAR